MIELPVTAAILMVGLIFLQYVKQRYDKEQYEAELLQTILKELAPFQSSVVEQQKKLGEVSSKVDTLMLRAGFK